MKKSLKVRNRNYSRELSRNAKRQFESKTYVLQLDNIITDIVVLATRHADEKAGVAVAASTGRSTLTDETVRASQDLADEVVKSIVRILKDDAVYYESPAALATRIQDLWKGERYRAARFARTFTADIAVATELQRYQEHGLEYVQFEAKVDDRTSDQCRMLHGTVMRADSAEARRLRCPLHHNCFVEGTRLELAGDIIAAFRGWYNGQVVELTLSNGSRLTITPNHMLLTPNGFLAAKFVSNGDDIICSASFKREILPFDPDNNNIKPTVEEVFRAFSVSSSMCTMSMPSAPMDLHNDGEFVKGNIDIVSPKCFLHSTCKSSPTEHFCKNLLSSTSECLSVFPCNRDLMSMLISMSLSTDGGMSGSRKTSSFFSGRLPHPDIHGFTSSPDMDSVLNQSLSDSVSITSEMCAECLDRLTTGIEADEFFNIDVNSSILCRLFSSTDWDTHLPKTSEDGIGFDIVPPSEFSRGYAGLIELCKVVEINVIPYHGYVYDFQTLSTLCIGNSAITSNCRSDLIPVPITTEIPKELLYENRDFRGQVSQDFSKTYETVSQEQVDVTFKKINTFNDKYRIDQYVLDDDIERRIAKEKGLLLPVRKQNVTPDITRSVSKKTKFAPAGNLRDASRWAQDNIADEVGFTRGMKVDGLNEINETVHNINSRFFDGKNLTFIGNPTVYEKAHSTRFGWRSQINAAYAPTLDTVLFKQKATDFAKLAELHRKSNEQTKIMRPVESLRNYLRTAGADPAVIKIADEMDQRVWTVSGTPKGTIAHEMGHRIYHQHPDKLELHKLLNEEYSKGWADVLCVYGKENTNEFFAETFSAYITGETSRISPALLKWIQKHDGDFK